MFKAVFTFVTVLELCNPGNGVNAKDNTHVACDNTPHSSGPTPATNPKSPVPNPQGSNMPLNDAAVNGSVSMSDTNKNGNGALSGTNMSDGTPESDDNVPVYAEDVSDDEKTPGTEDGLVDANDDVAVVSSVGGETVTTDATPLPTPEKPIQTKPSKPTPDPTLGDGDDNVDPDAPEEPLSEDPVPECDVTTPMLCSDGKTEKFFSRDKDGKCVDDDSQCPKCDVTTPSKCPDAVTDMFKKFNDYGECKYDDSVCPPFEVFPCIDITPKLCPDGITNIYKKKLSCEYDDSECPVVVNDPWPECDVTTSSKCPDDFTDMFLKINDSGECKFDYSECPPVLECGLGGPELCPDGKTKKLFSRVKNGKCEDDDSKCPKCKKNKAIKCADGTKVFKDIKKDCQYTECEPVGECSLDPKQCKNDGKFYFETHDSLGGCKYDDSVCDMKCGLGGAAQLCSDGKTKKLFFELKKGKYEVDVTECPKTVKSKECYAAGSRLCSDGKTKMLFKFKNGECKVNTSECPKCPPPVVDNDPVTECKNNLKPKTCYDGTKVFKDIKNDCKHTCPPQTPAPTPAPMPVVTPCPPTPAPVPAPAPSLEKHGYKHGSKGGSKGYKHGSKGGKNGSKGGKSKGSKHGSKGSKHGSKGSKQGSKGKKSH